MGACCEPSTGRPSRQRPLKSLYRTPEAAAKAGWFVPSSSKIDDKSDEITAASHASTMRNQKLNYTVTQQGQQHLSMTMKLQ